MDSLAGYIGAVCVSTVGTYLSQFLRPKIEIKYWLSHNFTYTIPNQQFNPAPNPPALPPFPAGNVAGQAAVPANSWLLTQSVTIQNFGRACADWVEIVHRQRPDFFQLYPALNYTESTSATGEHTLRVQSLASKEFFTIQFLCFTHVPVLMFIRSTAGHASPMPVMIVRQFPRWVQVLMQFAMIIGAGFCAYWIIKGGIFVFRSVSA